MRLDHDSGEMDGEVLAGAFAGARLSQLVGCPSCSGSSPSSTAWATRTACRCCSPTSTAGAAPEAEPPPQGGAAMSRAEAYRILGLPEGASVAEVRAAYHRLMKRVHPDLGGSSALAAMINAAKELLDPG